MRARLFGPARRPNLRIAADVKAKRLGKAGREAMLRALDALTGEFFEEASAHLRAALLSTYTAEAVATVRADIAKRTEGIGRRLADLERQHAEHRRVMSSVDALVAAADATESAVARLHATYGSTDPELLAEPVAEPVLGKAALPGAEVHELEPVPAPQPEEPDDLSVEILVEGEDEPLGST